MSKSEYLVEMNDISVEFPGVKALDGVKFNAIPGEVHVLLGENGAGKSTIMKVLAGVNTNYKGTIIWKGEEIVSRSIDEQRSRGVGIIFQELNLLKNLTVAENMLASASTTQQSRPATMQRKTSRTARSATSRASPVSRRLKIVWRALRIRCRITRS